MQVSFYDAKEHTQVQNPNSAGCYVATSETFKLLVPIFGMNSVLQIF
jgi:hypothetical protein